MTGLSHVLPGKIYLSLTRESELYESFDFTEILLFYLHIITSSMFTFQATTKNQNERY